MAVSPQTPGRNAEVRDRLGLGFPILSDRGNDYARRLSLVHRFPGDLRELYLRFGVSLPDYNGDESWELPIPARIVVGADGRIENLEADPDYTRRPEPAETLALL